MPMCVGINTCSRIRALAMVHLKKKTQINKQKKNPTEPQRGRISLKNAKYRLAQHEGGGCNTTPASPD